MIAFFFLAAFSDADAATLAMPEPIRLLLVSEHWADTPLGFRIVALSHVADACAAQAAAHSGEAMRCVAKASALAEKLEPKGFAADPASQGLYASHLNLILGDQDVVGGEHDSTLHQRLSEALAARSEQEPTHHVPSFLNDKKRWPADQTATLASLARFDRAHATHLAETPVSLWRDWIAAHAMAGELPWSEATGVAPHAKIPRGCALSFSIRYASEFDPALAARWWKAYRAEYLVDDVLLVGFREWPKGHGFAADADSGPIVMGVGSAATAFAQAAARAVGDHLLAARLSATTSVVGVAAHTSETMKRVSQSTLAAAILFQAAQRP